jgi:hypothetical protein
LGDSSNTSISACGPCAITARFSLPSCHSRSTMRFFSAALAM